MSEVVSFDDHHLTRSAKQTQSGQHPAPVFSIDLNSAKFCKFTARWSRNPNGVIMPLARTRIPVFLPFSIGQRIGRSTEFTKSPGWRRNRVPFRCWHKTDGSSNAARPWIRSLKFLTACVSRQSINIKLGLTQQ